MATLPAHFQFSQTNLQDYADCPRRFELRHLQRLQYPSIESEPQLEREAHQRRGEAFHRLLHQYHSGVPADIISQTVMDEYLALWWGNFMSAKMPYQPAKTHEAEITLSAPLGGYRVIAKYDLIAIAKTGDVWILDWKTQPAPPPRDILMSKMQTVIYPYILARAGASLTDGEAIAPEKIHMAYWYAQTGQLEIFDYDAPQFTYAETRLSRLIDQIVARDTFELTDNIRHCGFCTYRSLCRRGEAATGLDEDDVVLDIDDQFELDWERL